MPTGHSRENDSSGDIVLLASGRADRERVPQVPEGMNKQEWVLGMHRRLAAPVSSEFELNEWQYYRVQDTHSHYMRRDRDLSPTCEQEGKRKKKKKEKERKGKKERPGGR